MNPLFGPIGNYNGTTPVLPLLPGSPAIDSGYGANLTDQRGFTVDGPADIGSFQSRGFNVTPSAGTAQKVMIGDYFASNLTLAIVSRSGNEPVNGGLVTFTVPTGANLPSAVLSGSTTIAGGQVSMHASANAFYGTSANQRYSVLGTTTGALAPAAFELLNVGAPSNITATAGNYQSGDFNSNFTTPISISVKDSVGNNLENIALSFRTIGTSYGANGTINGGSLVSGITNANGTFGNITYRSNAVGGLVDIVANATVGASAVPGIRPATTATGHAMEGTVGINVQNGTAGRSFINSVSGLFGNATLASSLNSSGKVKIQYLGYSGTDTPVDVTRANATVASGNNVNWTFGPLTGNTTGITGDANSANGDGVYQVAVDYNNDGVYETAVKFHRLFGDVNGDAVVDTTDYNKVMSASVYGKLNVFSGENTNGVGQVYTKDITTVLRQRGRNISYRKY